jgi:hypothetical protein
VYHISDSMQHPSLIPLFGKWLSLLDDRNIIIYMNLDGWIDRPYEYILGTPTWCSKRCTIRTISQHSVKQSPLTTALARGILNLQFNSHLFKALLVQWTYTNNISFHVDKQPTFLLILGYLMAWVSVSPPGWIWIL